MGSTWWYSESHLNQWICWIQTFHRKVPPPVATIMINNANAFFYRMSPLLHPSSSLGTTFLFWPFWHVLPTLSGSYPVSNRRRGWRKTRKRQTNLTKILLAFQQQWCLRDLACVPCGFWVSPRTRGPNDLPWLLHHGARGSKATLRSGPRRVREAWLALIEQCEPDRNTGIRRSSVYDCLYFTILHILVSWIYVYVILCY